MSVNAYLGHAANRADHLDALHHDSCKGRMGAQSVSNDTQQVQIHQRLGVVLS